MHPHEEELSRWSSEICGLKYTSPSEIEARLEGLVESVKGRKAYVPKSVVDLLFAVTAIQMRSDFGRDNRTQFHRFRSTVAFRGESRTSWPLKSKLERQADKFTRSCYELEISLLRNFQKYAQEAVANLSYSLDHLALAQHHGLATRLLDWSYSPLVALHFVTSSADDWDEDGAVYGVDLRKARKHYPRHLKMLLEIATGIVPTAESIDVAIKLQLQDFRDQKGEAGRNAFAKHFLNRAHSSGVRNLDEEEADKLAEELLKICELDNSAEHWRLNWMSVFQAVLPTMEVTNDKDESVGSDKPFVLFYEAPSIAPRLVAQSSVFSLCSQLPSTTLVPSSESVLTDVLRDSNINLDVVVVPAKLKRAVRDLIDAYNISERTLMADLGGISSWLNRRYENKRPDKETSDGDTLVKLVSADPDRYPDLAQAIGITRQHATECSAV